MRKGGHRLARAVRSARRHMPSRPKVKTVVVSLRLAKEEGERVEALADKWRHVTDRSNMLRQALILGLDQIEKHPALLKPTRAKRGT